MPAKRNVTRLTPQAGFDHHPGLAAAHQGHPQAMRLLETALAAAQAVGKPRIAALASAALLITGQIRANFQHFPERIAALAPARDPTFTWTDADEELLALTGLLAGLLFFGNQDPYQATCVERIMTLLERDTDINLKFAAGRLVMFYCEPRDLRTLGQRVYSLLSPGIARTDLTPHRLGYWLVHWARVSRYAHEPRQAQLAEDQARKLADTHQLRDIQFWLAVIDVDRSLPERNLEQAERAIAVAQQVADPANVNDMLRLAFLCTKLAQMQNRGDEAVLHATRASGYAVELALPPAPHAVYIVNEAQSRLMVDDFAGALQLFRKASTMVPAQYVDEVGDMIKLTEAYGAMVAGKPEGLTLLRAAWTSVRKRHVYDVFEGFPQFGARVCALALENDIEVAFVRQLIEMRNIAPPANAPETWPWAVSVRTLGEFRLVRNGESVAGDSSAQKRPIELLKVLIAMGHAGATRQRLCELLWPDAITPGAPAALDVLILRLRKLLKNPGSVRIDKGVVALDTAHIWVDAWALDADVDALLRALHDDAAPATVSRISNQVLQRYRGPFLGNEDPRRWSLAARVRWQSRFRRSLADAGRYWEKQGEWPRAITLYERALEEDSLAEELYRRLMRAYLALDEAAEAARVYRRCRDMLEAQLGVPPSSETELLFKSIYAA